MDPTRDAFETTSAVYKKRCVWARLVCVVMSEFFRHDSAGKDMHYSLLCMHASLCGPKPRSGAWRERSLGIEIEKEAPKWKEAICELMVPKHVLILLRNGILFQRRQSCQVLFFSSKTIEGTKFCKTFFEKESYGYGMFDRKSQRKPESRKKNMRAIFFGVLTCDHMLWKLCMQP